MPFIASHCQCLYKHARQSYWQSFRICHLRPTCIDLPLSKSTMAVAFSRPAFYSSLAEEILDNILTCFIKESTTANRVALITCLQVSQQFYRIAVPLLYRTTTCIQPQPGYEANRSQLFQYHQNFFEANPDSAGSVRTLTLDAGRVIYSLIAINCKSD